MEPIKTFGLFALTAVAEIVGRYLPYLWLRDRAGTWVLAPAALSLVAFVWMLNLTAAAGGAMVIVNTVVIVRDTYGQPRPCRASQSPSMRQCLD